VRPLLEELRLRLKGRKGFVATGGSFAHALIGVLHELGIEVDGSVAYHHDLVYDSKDPRQDTLTHMVNTYGDVPNFTVSNYQHFQLLATLQRTNPDFAIIRHGGMAVLASRLGIPALPMADPDLVLGYQGILNLGEAILNILPNRVFYEEIAAHTRLPYKEEWLKQSDPMALTIKGNEKWAGDGGE
jgi:nitrogenase molybdenum-iron protein alpha chain